MSTFIGGIVIINYSHLPKGSSASSHAVNSINIWYNLKKSSLDVLEQFTCGICMVHMSLHVSNQFQCFTGEILPVLLNTGAGGDLETSRRSPQGECFHLEHHSF